MTHHENSRLHWSELPRRFLETLPAHDRACGPRPAARVCAHSPGQLCMLLLALMGNALTGRLGCLVWMFCTAQGSKD